jgi:hypothetical protein
MFLIFKLYDAMIKFINDGLIVMRKYTESFGLSFELANLIWKLAYQQINEFLKSNQN